LLTGASEGVSGADRAPQLDAEDQSEGEDEMDDTRSDDGAASLNEGAT
jgi:hypothetical protein